MKKAEDIDLPTKGEVIGVIIVILVLLAFAYWLYDKGGLFK